MTAFLLSWKSAESPRRVLLMAYTERLCPKEKSFSVLIQGYLRGEISHLTLKLV